jgi:hypothetical protein
MDSDRFSRAVVPELLWRRAGYLFRVADRGDGAAHPAALVARLA